MRREAVVGERFPIRQRPNIQVRFKPRHLLRETRHVGRVGADHQNSFASSTCFKRSLSQSGCIARLSGNRKAKPITRLYAGKVVGKDRAEGSHDEYGVRQSARERLLKRKNREISIMHKAVINGMSNGESLETRALRGMACASLRAFS